MLESAGMFGNQQMSGLTGQSCCGFLQSILGGLGSIGASAACAPDSNGWYPYGYDGPPKDKLLQFYQPTTGQVWVGYRAELHPEFNIANLKWRLTGIGKETP